MTTRTASGSGGTTATLSYDGLDDLVRWNDTNTTTNQEWYMYDASGQRVLRRSQTGTGNSNTRYTITAFGLEDHIYDGGGNNLNNKYYYALAGQLIGVTTGSINFLFSDALGSVVSSISNTANSASVKGNQLYSPYGNNPYSKGTMGTTRGYTGQYNDSLTQLDYYGARYYDPLVGVFLSADSVQGNLAGMNPYNYVGSNPETNIDPNGEMYAPPPGAQPQDTPPPPPPPGLSSLVQQTQNWQLSTCAQMAQAGHPCNVQITAQGPGQVVEYQRPSPLSVGCLVLLGPCVLVTTSSPERSGSSLGWVNPTFPVNICVPYCTKGDALADGEAGSSNGKESDLTRLIDDLTDNLLFSAEGGGEGESLGLGGNLGDAGSVPPSEGQPPQTGGESPHYPLQTGDDYERTFDTNVGRITVYAQVTGISDNGTISLHGIIYAEGVEGNELANQVGPLQMLRGLRAALRDLANMGFKYLDFEAYRAPNSSSANPGHEINRLIDLSPYVGE